MDDLPYFQTGRVPQIYLDGQRTTVPRLRQRHRYILGVEDRRHPMRRVHRVRADGGWRVDHRPREDTQIVGRFPAVYSLYEIWICQRQ